jgi:hypothetical protein
MADPLKEMFDRAQGASGPDSFQFTPDEATKFKNVRPVLLHSLYDRQPG